MAAPPAPRESGIDRAGPRPGSPVRVALAVCAGFAALLGLLVAVSWSPLIRLDDAVTDAVTRWVGERPALVDTATIVTDVLAPWPLRVLALVVAAGLAVRGHRRAAVWVVAVLGAGALTSGGLKLLVSRARPTLDDPLLDQTGYAWPSGHALAGALVAALLVTLAPPRVRRWLLPVAVVGAAAVGLTRVALGVHWTSDVVSGWLLGAAVVLAATVVAPPYRGREETPQQGQRRYRSRRCRTATTSTNRTWSRTS